MKHTPALMLALATALALTACAATTPVTKTDATDPWAALPKILARIVPPKFPARDFDVTKFGAIGDGSANCTKAFAEAISACNKAGGGRVVVPAGKFLTGAIHLKSGVNLHVTKDATILFSTNPQDYLPVVFTRFECTELMNYSPLIYAFEQKNVAITGEGTLDSQAKAGVWHSWKDAKTDKEALNDMAKKDVPVAERIFGDGHQLRPYFIQPTRCQNVLIEGVKILGSPMWVISPLYCTNVTVQGVTVEAEGPNTDGCDPDSCTDVLIKDCNFSDGDDCIAIKSGRDYDGHRVNIASRNIIIQNCKFEAGHGGVTCGSETSAGIDTVYAEDCSFDSPDLDMALRFKTNPARGGYIKNVFIRNCKIQTSKFGIHMTLRYSAAGARDGQYIPELGNINIHNCTFANLTKQPVFIEGYDEKIKITGVTISNCTFLKAKTPGATVTNAADIHFVNNHGSGME